ncbi:hypothetical protein HDK64DRAFT_4299 [Phyllosticta capitalensis]
MPSIKGRQGKTEGQGEGVESQGSEQGARDSAFVEKNTSTHCNCFRCTPSRISTCAVRTRARGERQKHHPSSIDGARVRHYGCRGIVGQRTLRLAAPEVLINRLVYAINGTSSANTKDRPPTARRGNWVLSNVNAHVARALRRASKRSGDRRQGAAGYLPLGREALLQRPCAVLWMRARHGSKPCHHQAQGQSRGSKSRARHARVSKAAHLGPSRQQLRNSGTHQALASRVAEA